MDAKEMSALVQALLDDIKRTHFTKGYDASNEEAMGILLTEFFERDGIAVLEAASVGLEDANFRTLAGKVDRLIIAETKRIDREVKAQARRSEQAKPRATGVRS